jgi:F-type H+-transporting ATPase subunit delta
MKTARQAQHEAQSLWRACLIDGRLDAARTRLVVDQAIASHRTGTFAVLNYFFRLLRLEIARHTAVVTTATALDAGLRQEVERVLTSRYGATTAVTFAVDPALIGGMRVQVGSDLYDGSVKGGLSALASRF